jgi:hypothetical protein
MKIYKLGLGWLIATFVVFIPLIGLFAWLLISPLFAFDWDGMRAYWFFILPSSLLAITFVTLGLIDGIKGRFIIDQEKLTSLVFSEPVLFN